MLEVHLKYLVVLFLGCILSLSVAAQDATTTTPQNKKTVTGDADSKVDSAVPTDQQKAATEERGGIGSDLEDAAKDTGDATKHAGEKVGDTTKKAVDKSADATKDGAKKVEGIVK